MHGLEASLDLVTPALGMTEHGSHAPLDRIGIP
jgi:hypothetical protein